MTRTSIVNGRAVACRPRRNGKKPRVDRTEGFIRGEIPLPTKGWQISRRATLGALFRYIAIPTAQVLMVFLGWQGMSGNGPQTGSSQITMPLHQIEILRGPLRESKNLCEEALTKTARVA